MLIQELRLVIDLIIELMEGTIYRLCLKSDQVKISEELP